MNFITYNEAVPLYVRDRFQREVERGCGIGGVTIQYDPFMAKEAMWWMNWKLGWLDNSINATIFKERTLGKRYDTSGCSGQHVPTKVMDRWERPLDRIRTAD